jgi:hypothetical protein
MISRKKSLEFQHQCVIFRRDTESSDTTEKIHFVEKKGQARKEPGQKVENKPKEKMDDDKTQKRGKKGKMKKLKLKYKDQVSVITPVH